MKHMLMREDGISLVEILIAVTIMSLITVFIMSYFVQAMEKSADQSRRVIAANLARMKAAELRHVFGEKAPFGNLKSALKNGLQTVKSNADIPDTLSHLIDSSSDSSGGGGEGKISFDAWDHPDNTTYRYLISFTNVSRVTEVINAIPDSAGKWDDYVIPVKVTVYWTASEVSEGQLPSSKLSVGYDTYIVKRGELE